MDLPDLETWDIVASFKPKPGFGTATTGLRNELLVLNAECNIALANISQNTFTHLFNLESIIVNR